MTTYNVVSPSAMVAGQPEDISVVLANFNAIAAVLNGNIDNANIVAAAGIVASKLAGYPADITKLFRGDGSWSVPSIVTTGVNIGAANTDLASPGIQSLAYIAASTGGGTVRSIGAATIVGSRYSLRNGSASSITLKHQLAGGSGAQLFLRTAADTILLANELVEFVYDGSNWVEITRDVAGGSMVQLYDNVAGGAIASWDVQNISQAYSHLRIVLLARGDTAANTVDVLVRFNNDSAANYDNGQMLGSSGTATNSENFGSTGCLIQDVTAASGAASLPGMDTLDIPSYAATTFNKVVATVGVRKYGTSAGNLKQWVTGSHWRSTAAINRITVLPTAGNFVAGSRLSIYGLL